MKWVIVFYANTNIQYEIPASLIHTTFVSCNLQRSAASKYFGVQFKSNSLNTNYLLVYVAASRDLLRAQVLPHTICIQWNLSNTDTK